MNITVTIPMEYFEKYASLEIRPTKYFDVKIEGGAEMYESAEEFKIGENND